jgi:serine/threonine-protein kinase
VDVYAFGVTAYETLVGKSPFHGLPPHAVLAAHLSEPPRPVNELRPEIPGALVALVMRCLEKNPADRPQQASEILTALEDPAVLSGELTPSSVTGASVVARAAKHRARRRLLGAAAGVILLAAGVGGYLASRGPDAGATPGAAPVAGATAVPSIAVFPFVFLGADSGDVAAEAIASELTSALVGERRVRVASQTAAIALQQELAHGRSVGNAVTLYVEGVVQREGDRIRVDARMVNAADGFMVWAESYEGTANQLFALRSEIGASVLDALRDQLGLASDSTSPAPATR